MPAEPNSLLQRITPCIHTHIRFCSKMEIFISSLAYHPHVSSENSHRKHIFSKTLSRVGPVFENAGFSFTCGQTKMEVFKYVDVIHHIYTSSMTHAPKGMVSYFHRFSFFVWTGEKDLNMLRVDAYFLKREDILMHVDGAIIDVLIIARYSKIWYPKNYHSFSTIQIHPVCHNTYFNTLFETSSKSSNVFLDTWSQIGICRGYNTQKKLIFMEIKHHHGQWGENFKQKIYLKNKVVSIISICL